MMEQDKLKIRLYPKQLQVINLLNNDSDNIIIYSGSVGSGKSYLGSVFLILACLKYPGIRVAMCRNHLSVMYSTTYKTFIEVIHKFGLKDNITINLQRNTIKFHNGSEVVMLHTERSVQDPEYQRFGGLELTYIWIDEFEMDKRCFNILNTRCRFKLKQYELIKKVLVTTNPISSWPYEFYKKWKNGTLPPNVKMIFSKTSDNLSLPADYIKTLSELPEPDYSRLFLGKWDYVMADKFFQRIYLENLFNIKTQTNNNKCITIDVASMGKDRMILLVWEGLKVVDFLVEEKTFLPSLKGKVNKFQQMYNIMNGDVVIDAVGLGTQLSQELFGCYKFTANASPKNSLYADARTECIFLLKNLITEVDLSILIQYAELIVREFEAHDIDYNSQKTKIISKDIVKKNLGASPDFFDSIYMRMIKLIKNKSISC